MEMRRSNGPTPSNYFSCSQNIPEYLHCLSQWQNRQSNHQTRPEPLYKTSMNLLTQNLTLGFIAFPASFVNSFLEFLNKRLAINIKKRLTRYFHETYLKDMIFYQLGNLDSRVSNPDQRLTADI